MTLTVKLSDKNLTGYYYTYYPEGHPYYPYYPHPTQPLGAGFSRYFPAFYSVWAFTNDSSVRARVIDYLKAFAKYQVAYNYGEIDTFIYLVDIDTGKWSYLRTDWAIGYGIEALIVLYYLTGNSTYFDMVKETYDFLISKRNFFYEDLQERLYQFNSTHFWLFDQFWHSVPRFSSLTPRVCRILYTVNETWSYRNDTIWNDYWTLYINMETKHRAWGGFKSGTNTRWICTLNGSEVEGWFHCLSYFYDFIRLYPESDGWNQWTVNNLEDLKE